MKPNAPFAKLSLRTQQLADSMVDRVDNLIKEWERLRNHNKELKTVIASMQRDYQGLISIPEVRKILDDAEIEKSEYIKALLKEYEQED